MDGILNGKLFSFKIDGVDYEKTEHGVNKTVSENSIMTEYTFSNGLKVTNIAKKYTDFGAYEWVNYFENTSSLPTGIISDLYDCDCVLPMEHEENRTYTAYIPDKSKATKIYSPTGSLWNNYEFSCDVDKLTYNNRDNHIHPNETKEYKNIGGRSSDGLTPIFNIHKNGKGYFFAIGWTGQWNCKISRTNDDIRLLSKIENTYFRLMPGEKIRTSSAVILPYTAEFNDSFNIWRRFIKKHFLPLNKGTESGNAPLCAGIWGGMRSASAIERINKINDLQLPFEYIWIDAGWYGKGTKSSPDEFEGDWFSRTGDWRISEDVHPNKMKDISEAIHSAGMKFLLWFEPERCIYTKPAVLEHPEYFISPDSADDNSRLLNLGNPEAWNYCFSTLCDIIEELHIDCYRQDFNVDPLPFWNRNDAPDRKGITEIKHINGLYRLWDSLLERYPDLLIDNCASGGRRIDIETLKRSIPLWKTDATCPANYDIETVQCINQSSALLFPISGTGTGRAYDEYRVRSSYTGALTTNYSFSERNEFCKNKEEAEFLKKYMNEYLKVRPYFYEDVYLLTETSDKTDIWSATQYDRPENGDGVILVYRRENSPYVTSVFNLHGIDESKNYHFSDADGGDFLISGYELQNQGLKITINEKRKAKIWFYNVV